MRTDSEHYSLASAVMSVKVGRPHRVTILQAAHPLALPPLPSSRPSSSMGRGCVSALSYITAGHCAPHLFVALHMWSHWSLCMGMLRARCGCHSKRHLLSYQPVWQPFAEACLCYGADHIWDAAAANGSGAALHRRQHIQCAAEPYLPPQYPPSKRSSNHGRQMQRPPPLPCTTSSSALRALKRSRAGQAGAKLIHLQYIYKP